MRDNSQQIKKDLMDGGAFDLGMEGIPPPITDSEGDADN
jgi:hypothetical protein